MQYVICDMCPLTIRLWFCKLNSELKVFWSQLSPAKCRQQTAAVRQFKGQVDVFVSWTGLFWTPTVQSLSLTVQKCRTGRSCLGYFDGWMKVPKWPKSSRVKIISNSFVKKWSSQTIYIITLFKNMAGYYFMAYLLSTNDNIRNECHIYLYYYYLCTFLLFWWLSRSLS